MQDGPSIVPNDLPYVDFRDHCYRHQQQLPRQRGTATGLPNLPRFFCGTNWITAPEASRLRNWVVSVAVVLVYI